MKHLNMQTNHSRVNSGIAQLSPNKCTTFRTILKPRNDTILMEQLNVNPSLQRSKVKITEHTTSQSQIFTNEEQSASKFPTLEDSRCSASKKSIKQSRVITPRNSSLSKSRSVVEGQQTPIKQKKLLSQLQKQLVFEEKKEKVSIEELQKKMDNLIIMNFQRFRKQKKEIGLSKWQKIRHEASIDNQLQDIISFVSNLKLLQGENHQSMDNINKKIEILQKMIASEVAESQTLKNRYLGWKSQKMNTTSFINKNLYSSANTLKKQDKTQVIKNGRQSSLIKSSEMVGNYASITKLSYKKPSKEYYAKPKHAPNLYTANRQSMPHSSYSAQFLNFGCIPNYSYKSNLQRPLVKMPLSVTISSYQQQYQDKLKLVTKFIDFKELDCYQDKIKNSNMPFIHFNAQEINQKNSEKMRKNHHHFSRQNLKYIDSSKNQQRDGNFILTSLQVSPNFYKSQQNRQFKWPNIQKNQTDEGLLKSEIKNKKLLQMKSQFKAMTMRC